MSTGHTAPPSGEPLPPTPGDAAPAAEVAPDGVAVHGDDAAGQWAAGDAPGVPVSATAGPSWIRGAWRFLREILILLAVSILVAGLIKTLVFQVFYIPSGSMEQTLLIGDRVGVDKVSYRFSDIERGDVIVFRGPPSWVPEVTVDAPDGPVEEVGSWMRGLVGLPTNERDFIKRVIALGGDTVQCCDDIGRLLVNGQPLDEPYVYDNTPLEQRAFGPVLVPEGRLFVMGDHRGLSADSRYHLDDGYSGTVPEDAVVGRAFVVIWPASEWKTLPVPETFDSVPPPSDAAD